MIDITNRQPAYKMGSVFNIVEHVLPGQHIREYVHSINGPQETVIQLAIKQYVPKDRLDPMPKNAITIIGTHGTGFPKVCIFLALCTREKEHVQHKALTTRRNYTNHYGRIYIQS